MKLSEAIRLGAMLKPQAFGDFFVNGGTCALGAAADACGLLAATTRFKVMNELFLVLSIRAPFPCGCNICQVAEVSALIPHLNDAHKWTREQIADQVEIWEKEFERAEAAPTEDAQPAIG